VSYIKYDEPEAGEWVKPIRKGYRLKCCKCGLVHFVDFRLTKRKSGGNFIWFRAFLHKPTKSEKEPRAG
jgi:hypothetical protein